MDGIMIKRILSFGVWCGVALCLRAGERASFDFDWKFKYMGAEIPSWIALPKDESGFKDVQLPHDWAIESDFLPNEPNETGKLPWNGYGIYVKSFNIPESYKLKGRKIFIDFDGVMQRPEIYVNGQKAGEWKYGYASFRIDATDYLVNGENKVHVVVSNPPRSTRWYPGAGIYRNVWIENAPLNHIAYNGVYVTTPSVDKSLAVVKIETTVDNDGDSPSKRLLRQRLDGKSVEKFVEIKAHDSVTVTQEIRLTKPRLWSLAEPELYTLVTEIVNSQGSVLDSKKTRIGLRKAEWRKDGFYLNGKRTPLNGVCEHHDLGCLGSAFYPRGYERKVKKLKEMGVNSIRMTHNPPAPEVLDICDREGILVIDELFDIWKHQKVDKVWGYHRYWPEWWQKDVRNFVMRDRNHPCVIAWSGGNEVPENHTNCRDGREVSKMLRAEFRKYDMTRPYTVGTNDPAGMDNGFSETQDVFGFNYKPHLYAKFHQKYPNQPMYGSETCSGISSRDEYFFPYKWGQGSGNRNYQVSSYGQCAVPWGNVADQEWAMQEANPFVAGEYVWTGFDYLGEPTPYNLDASNVNNFNDLPPAERAAMMKKLEETAGRAPSRSSYFGLIDLAGFPKDNFYLYQSHWRKDLPMAHILPHWNWAGRDGEITPVVVYSSGDEAELFVNGKSQGVRKRGERQYGNFTQKTITVGRNDYRFVWENVRYEPGTVEVKVKKNGRVWAQAKRVTTGAAVRVIAETDRSKLSNEGHDIAHIELALVDEKGNHVPTDNRKVSFEVEGSAAKLIGFCNGNATDWTCMQKPNQKFFNGRILAVLRGERGEKGDAVVVVRAEGLDPIRIPFVVK